MARSFNGTSDYIVGTTVGSYSSGPLTLTMSCWFNAVSNSNGQGFMALGTTADPNGTQCRLSISTANLIELDTRFNGGSGDLHAQSSNTFTTNTWNHAAAIINFNSSFVLGTVTCFLNGTANNTTFTQAITTTITGFSFGAIDLVGQTQANFFNGAVADGAYWNTTLTAGEISALAAGARPRDIRPGNLKGYWPITGLQSPEPDLSGLAQNGTVTGTANASGPPLMQFTPRWPQFIPTVVSSVKPFPPFNLKAA